MKPQDNHQSYLGHHSPLQCGVRIHYSPDTWGVTPGTEAPTPHPLSPSCLGAPEQAPQDSAGASDPWWGRLDLLDASGAIAPAVMLETHPRDGVAWQGLPVTLGITAAGASGPLPEGSGALGVGDRAEMLGEP